MSEITEPKRCPYCGREFTGGGWTTDTALAAAFCSLSCAVDAQDEQDDRDQT